MMKTILIVDDDYIARNKISALLQWERHGYQIVGEASNGIEALEAIKENMPDIVLVDMDMPVMNGVELIREIKKDGYPVSVIVLSSYNDFDYVRESMKLGALDYILKSEISSGLMLKALSATEERKKIQDTEKLSAKDRQYIRELYMRRILLNIYPETESRQWISDYGLPLDKSRNLLGVFEIDGYMRALEELDEKGMFTFHQFTENMIKEAVSKNPEMSSVKIKEDRYCLILSCREMNSIHDAQQIMIRTLEDIKRNFIRYLNLTITGSAGSICPGLENLAKSYKILEKRLKNKFYSGKGQIVMEDIVETDFEGNRDDFEVKINAQIEMQLPEEKERIISETKHFFSIIRRYRPEEAKAKKAVNRLLGKIEEDARKKKIDFSTTCGLDEITDEIRKAETLEEIEKQVEILAARFCEMLQIKENSRKYSKLTRRAIEYLEHNFKERISLSETAEYLNVSSSHLSRVFKNDTGMNLVNYLNRIRIEKAKQILKKNEDISIKHIAYEMGFNNYNHFFSTFKSMTGMSPQEYQEGREKSN